MIPSAVKTPEVVRCAGRVYAKSSAAELSAAFSFAERQQGDGLDNLKPRFNGSPGQDYPLFVKESDMPGARWGLIPAWNKDPNPKIKPINATAERVA